MKNAILFLFVSLLTLLLTACGAQVESIGGEDTNPASAPSPADMTAQAIVARMEEASATAAVSATSTARTDYADETTAARELWNEQGIQSYELTLRFNSPEATGTQNIRVTVTDGEVSDFAFDCFPAEVCQRIRIQTAEDEAMFTVDGIFDELEQLAAEQFPLAFVTFDETYGYPLSIVANNEESPYYIAWRVDRFAPQVGP